MISERLIQRHLQTDEESWPPIKPKKFTPLVLIQYKDGHRDNLEQYATVAKFVEPGNIDKIAGCNAIPNKRPKLSEQALQEVFDGSKITKEVVKILSPLEKSNDPQFILIKGAPGIGKSLLLKEIAYLWGKKMVMDKVKLVLLISLRDPAVQKMSNYSTLFVKETERPKKLLAPVMTF